MIKVHDKLKLLLSKINLPDNYYEAFNNGKILKLRLDNARRNGTFVVELDNILPSNILSFVNENIKNGFPDMDSMKIEFVIKNINYNDSVKFN